jgi:hypothetical protein
MPSLFKFPYAPPTNCEAKQCDWRHVRPSISAPVIRGDMHMTALHSLFNEADLTFGLLLSVCLGSILGLIMDQHLGHLIFGSAVGVLLVLLYFVSYSLSVLWMAGLRHGVIMVTVFVWSIILSVAL